MKQHVGENALLVVNALSLIQWLAMKLLLSCCSAICITEIDFICQSYRLYKIMTYELKNVKRFRHDRTT
jgi:hypothetical protein